MENKQTSSKNKAKPILEEKLIREVDYDAIAGVSRFSKKLPPEVVSEKLYRIQNFKSCTQKVVVCIKPRAPAIKTLYIAEKNRFHPKKRSDKSGSRLAVGDHSSFTIHLSDDDSSTINSIVSTSHNQVNFIYRKREKDQTSTEPIETSTVATKCSNTDSFFRDETNRNKQRAGRCFAYIQPQVSMTIPKIEPEDNCRTRPKKINIGTFVVTNTSSQDLSRLSPTNVNDIYKRIDHLERKILRQEMVFRSLDPNLPLSSSDDETKDNDLKKTSNTGCPGCSYVEYSQIPETSAFQRYLHQPAPLSASKATTIQKEHNSEQYGRDFTLYDNVTARGRRQCASVPCKRNDVPKLAAERVHKIRHKLNPVRDYRLMDTVHYLAQGEFAPRDDGIKLTPSREAVLSDIIYEDVCRTHWPSARLGRRVIHPERCATRSDLQRLIDSLLRERVANVERRRRRHYRIVKLNHRHESCRPLGKTGDIIVASHKGKSNNEDGKEIPLNEHNALMPNKRSSEKSPSRNHKSNEASPESRQQRRFGLDDSSPGPSYSTRHSAACREPTCCYHTLNSAKPARNLGLNSGANQGVHLHDHTSGSSITTGKIRPKTPRLVVKKNSSRKRYSSNEPNLEHFILLPTLVIRTPSNMRRQKKFNELYQRILNVQLNNGQKGIRNTHRSLDPVPNKKDIGFNINITLSDSEERNLKGHIL